MQMVLVPSDDESSIIVFTEDSSNEGNQILYHLNGVVYVRRGTARSSFGA